MKSKSNIVPWTYVFTKPREIAQEVALTKPNRGLVWLSGFYGFFLLLQCMQSSAAGMSYPLWTILLFAVLIAIPTGFVSLTISGWLLWWTGKLLKGKGDFTSVRSVLAWSKIPELVGLFGWVLLIVFYGVQTFDPVFIQQNYTFAYFTIPTGVVLFQIIFSVWGLVVLLHMLSEVQGFSVWMALLNVILKSIVFALLVSGIMWFAQGFVS